MASVEYYFNNLDHSSFQRLINAILAARFGESFRTTPLQGSDGGRDGETATYNPFFEFQVQNVNAAQRELIASPQKGRYLFQVKYHRTLNGKLTDVRKTVISDFEKELKKNVLSREGKERVNFFFLLTNVPSSEKAISDVDRIQESVQSEVPYHLYADVWWGERIESLLDQMPMIWYSFPSLFAGGKIPFLAEIMHQEKQGLPRAIRAAINRQYDHDSNVKFRQIDLSRDLSELFVDLDVSLAHIPLEQLSNSALVQKQNFFKNIKSEEIMIGENIFTTQYAIRNKLMSALFILLDEKLPYTRKIILEGGPGQGKSTVTQMLIQIYRQQLLSKVSMNPDGRWELPQKSRFPLRIELRIFAEWLSKKPDSSIEEYLAYVFKQDSGGASITVDDIHNIIEGSPVMLIFDGLDEVGNDNLKDQVLTRIAECIQRFEEVLLADLRVIITTRPPAVASCTERLEGFYRYPITPLADKRINDYVNRWVSIQVQDDDIRREVKESFQRRKKELHVQAIARNPMQLSILLHFIRLKGAAFPARRSELYREYFHIVIDRDVEKSIHLAAQREVIEGLHQFLGYKIHALSEAEKSDGSLSRADLLYYVESWLRSIGNFSKTANELFELGRDRLGLIVALKGEGEDAFYGFEVQPIREYFASAFINSDIKGNAHNVFSEMVRRPFWREVALFLAGLRRPNEKADLVVRAKALDRDEKLGWRQDGRRITLQLLAEGVFSQPPHVFSDALEFVFDLLDPSLVRAQNEPKDLIRVLSSLIKQDQVIEKQYAEKLLHLLQNYKTSEDKFILYRLYDIAHELLGIEKMKRELLSYQGTNVNIIVMTRILWMLRWKIDISAEAMNPSFWENVPDDIWSATLWNAITNFTQISSQSIPSKFHQYLLEQMAVNPISTPISSKISVKSIPSQEWAVYKLINYQRAFSIFGLSIKGESEKDGKKLLKQFLDIQEQSSIDLTGLDKEYHDIVINLIQLSKKVLDSLFSYEEKQTKNVLDEYISAIQFYLKQTGLVGWVACSHGLSFLQAMLLPGIDNTVFSSQEFISLYYHINSFYFEREENVFLLNEENEILSISRFRRSLMSKRNLAPGYILLKENEDLVRVTDLIVDNILNNKEYPFEWIDRMPFTTSMIRPLVENCREKIPALLSLLSEKQFPDLLPCQPLLISDIQRVLKIVRNTDDPKILFGAFIALYSSKFLRSAGPKLVLKLIQASAKDTRLVESLLTSPNVYRSYGTHEISSSIEYFSYGTHERYFMDEDSKKIINDVASTIIINASDYDFKTVSLAASYLSERIQINSTPLLSLEREFEITN